MKAIIPNHTMVEDQAQILFNGTTQSMNLEQRFRSGQAKWYKKAGKSLQKAQSKPTEESFRLLCETQAKHLMEHLKAYRDAPLPFGAQVLVRARNNKTLFSGFWGWFKPEGKPKTYFGGNGKTIRYRRGPWEPWLDLELKPLRRISSKLPTIFSPYCATGLHEALGHAMEADYLPASPLAGGFGKKWSCAELSVMDRPDLPDLAGTMEKDDCGLPASATTMMHRGFLVGDLGFQSGCFRRGTYRDLPLIRVSNFVIREGSADPHAWFNLPETYYIAWVESGQWLPGTASMLLKTGPAFLLSHGSPVRFARSMHLKYDLTLFLKHLQEVGSDITVDPATHWCVKRGQAVPMGMASPSLFLEGRS